MPQQQEADEKCGLSAGGKATIVPFDVHSIRYFPFLKLDIIRAARLTYINAHGERNVYPCHNPALPTRPKKEVSG